MRGVMRAIILSVFLAAVLGGLILAAGQPKYGGVLKVGLSVDPPDLNPFLQSGGAAERVKTAVYDSLLRYKMNGEVVPALAESWEILDDNKTYIFHLRPNVHFHNGELLTAEDVEFSLRMILDPTTGAFLHSDLSASVEEIHAIDASTVRITLKEPNAAFLGLLGMVHASIVSKDWVEAGHDLNHEMMGTGAFKFVSWEPGVRLVLRKNEDYWIPGLPYLDGITFIPIKDEDVRVNALIAHEVDFIDFPPWKAWDAIEATPGLTVDKTANFAMVLFFNPNAGALGDPRVRQAIKYAIDDRVIADVVFFGHAQPSGGGLLPPGHWATSEDIQSFFSYNPDKSRQLLAEAGYPNGFSMKLLATSTYGMHRMTAEVVQDLLKQVGIEVVLELEEWGTTIERRAKGDYEAMVYACGLTRPDPDFYSSYVGSAAGFYARPVGFRDPIMDELLELGRVTLDRALRKRIYHVFELRFLEQCPIAVLARRESGFAYSTDVKDFLNFALGYFSCVKPWDGVWLDR